ncbi:hypothetical protein [Winogradskyella epiphytica]|uniref:hypothetical protein n=1 Tax=Winogradskyella epiphytica TaxID=262005 RepID=UPI0011B64BF4|nr:hypothetical protein [Winogradskyella epiphytica]
MLALGVLYVGLQGFAYQKEGTAVSAIMLILLTWLYYKEAEKKNIYFFLFLITFTIAHVVNFITFFTPAIPQGDIDYWYFFNNILYIISYSFLMIKVLTRLNPRKIIKELFVPIIILIVLDVFCVIIITDTAEKLLTTSEYILEFVYNSIVMALLSVGLINYMYRNDNKSMLFLIGSILIVFSEIIQLAYFYILDDSNLGLVYSFLLFVAFLFLYLQSQQQYSGPMRIYVEDTPET